MIRASDAIAAARALIGTPYSELDCINLIKKIIRTAPGGVKGYQTAGTASPWASGGPAPGNKYRDLTERSETISGAKSGMLAFKGKPLGRDCQPQHVGLVTEHGTVTAEKIVFACHYPFVNFPGLYFARMHQERSYVLALENAPMTDGMWVFADGASNPYSFRTWNHLLLLGGGGHRCGENSTGGKYDELRRKAREWFPQSRETAHWSAQDCMTADSVPYIGQYAASRPDWFVATGFQKWGMTTSMVSAMLLRDLICGKKNPNAEVFAPGRFDTETISGVLEGSGHAVKGLTKRLFQIPVEAAGKLAPGHGGIVFLDGEKLGVYKDEDGTIYPVELRCPHLGCQLEWNPDEKSWGYPCHGTRFDRFGALISGPAQTGTHAELKNA